jgi:hypothetical protein
LFIPVLLVLRLIFSPQNKKNRNEQEEKEGLASSYVSLPRLLLIPLRIDRCAARVAGAELPSTAALKRFFIRAEADFAASGQYALDLVVRARDDVNADQFADPSSRRGTGVRSRFHRADIAADKDRDVPGSDVFLTHKLHVRGLDHRIGRLHGTDKTFGLDHSECFQTHQIFLAFCIRNPIEVNPKRITLRHC